MLRHLIAAISAVSMLISPAFAFTSGNVVTYSDNTGAHVQDSGVASSNIVQTNTSAVLTGLTIGTDQFSGAFGTLGGMIEATGGNNAFVGEVLNNAAPGSSVLPAAVSGASKVTTNGNIAFGHYGLCEARWSTGGVCVGGEVTTRNFTSNNPDTGLPAGTGFNNSSTTLNGFQITCGAGNGETKDCSIGLVIANESGSASDPIYTTGAYIYRYRTNGLVIPAMPSGSQTGALIQGNGNGTVLQVQTTAEPVSTNLVLNMENHTAANIFSVDTTGAIYTGSGGTKSVSCSANSVSLTTLVVTNGIVTHC